MYYVDLSPYSYYLDFLVPSVRNIGWIDDGVDFPKGIMPINLLEKMKNILIKSDLVNAHVNLVRGVHPCTICGCEDVVRFADKKIILGMSEIWIPNSISSGFFAAPSMVVHYIEKHNYLPPGVFLTAIESFSFEKYFNAQEVYVELTSDLGSSS